MMSGNHVEAKGNDDHFTKLFIGGLHIQTTNETLRAFYEHFGEVVDCVVMVDSNTLISRCFGFVTFSQSEMVDNCMANRPHHIDGKKVDPKRAMPKNDGNKSEMHQSVKKVFIGGLRDLTENDIKHYFCTFGNIEVIDIISDKATGKSKGFCFLTYDDTDSVDKIVLMKRHKINGVDVEAKKAEEKRPSNVMAGAKRTREGVPLGRGTVPRNVPVTYSGQQNYGTSNYLSYPGNYGAQPNAQGGQWNSPGMFIQGFQNNNGYHYGQTNNNGYHYGQTNNGEDVRSIKHARRAGPYDNSSTNSSLVNRRSSAPLENQSNYNNPYYSHV